MASKTPTGLGKGGRALWREVTANHNLRADSLRVLTDACHEADLIDDLQSALKDTSRTTRGSMGQEVIHPLISELRQHRIALNTLLKALQLESTDTAADDKKFTLAREAATSLARARWSKAG